MNLNIDYRYLKAFLKTAKYLNFSRAAQDLSIAQSAISRQIKLLEEGMGEQLIIRSSKKVILTQKGKELLRAISHFEELTSQITNNQDKKLIKIGIFHGLLETWFIGVLKDYIKKTPHELKISIDTPAHLKEGLMNGRFDIIFSNENIQNELATSLALFDEKLAVISKKDIDLKKLAQYTWIVYDESDFLIENYKVPSEKVIIVQSMTTIIKLVKENIGIAVVPEHLVRKEDRLVLNKVKSNKKPKIHLSTLNYTQYPAHLSFLIDTIKKHSL